MRRSKVVNWSVEIAALRDMSVTACESHRIAAEALWESIGAAASRPNGVRDQKVLTAKIAAEAIGALEDLGALIWSVANRSSEGVLRRYLTYEPKAIGRFYERISAGEPVRLLLNLPSDESLLPILNRSDLKVMASSLDELQKVLKVAAADYLALDGALVRTYNKIKHGFVVVQRLDNLVPSRTPPTEWRQNVNVVTGMTANGSVRYTDLERSAAMRERLMSVIKMCTATWKELASLAIWLWEHQVPLDGT